jgi:hypothetical protein
VLLGRSTLQPHSFLLLILLRVLRNHLHLDFLLIQQLLPTLREKLHVLQVHCYSDNDALVTRAYKEGFHIYIF